MAAKNQQVPRRAARPGGAAAANAGKKRRFNYPRSGMGPIRRWVPSWRAVLAAAVAGVAVLVGLFAAAYATTDVPDPGDFAQAQTTTVYYSDGETELGSFAEFDRESVALSTLPEYVGHAVVASEDRRFYENVGIDPVGIARAFWNNIRGGQTQGGSTLTQQYVERYYLGTTTSYSGKFREAILALKIDREESKDTILENYLNTIFYGRGSYGIERAAQNYFGKPAAELTLSEAALLAGVIPAPNAWDPRVDAEQAELRWNRVLDFMVRDGWITQDERDEQVFPETIEYSRSDTYAGPEGYLLDMVRSELVAAGELTDAELDTLGLRITTTIDQRSQDAAVAVVDSLPEDRPDNNRVALVSVDPSSGAIVSLYGGPDFVTQSRNAATQDVAQAGSTFKPFALVAALQNDVRLEDRYRSYTPMEIEGYDRPVNNYDTVNRGRIDLVEATAHSVNTVYAQLNVEVGPELTMQAAIDAGLPEDTPGLAPVPSNVLGPASPHPLDMAQAYATFAAQGVRHEPYIVAEVKDSDGEVIHTGGSEGQRVFDEDVMAEATYAMTSVIERGTGVRADDLGRPAAGKTGTSNDARSAWFAGYVPQLATVIAMYQVGEDGTEESLTPFGEYDNITGSTYPTTMWRDYMQVATEGMEPLEFPARPDLEPVEREPREEETEERAPAPRETRTEEPEPEPETVAVPGVVGQDEGSAVAALGAAGLGAQVVAQPSDQPAGTVISTDPGGGAAVAPGSTVTVVVSSGPAPEPPAPPTTEPEPEPEPTAEPTPAPSPSPNRGPGTGGGSNGGAANGGAANGGAPNGGGDGGG
ncbi:penicillin-binding protein [Georgenia faecalis]|uniref:Penicillin-binding protein n=1 Tax=Georgenia faecalis TaxID=2483799 RepID=A0ABV9D8T3_9MICO|nr:penicillin-binding protein [Georgenia faecalis]